MQNFSPAKSCYGRKRIQNYIRSNIDTEKMCYNFLDFQFCQFMAILIHYKMKKYNFLIDYLNRLTEFWSSSQDDSRSTILALILWNVITLDLFSRYHIIMTAFDKTGIQKAWFNVWVSQFPGFSINQWNWNSYIQ